MKLIMADDGRTPETEDASYDVSGDHITIRGPTGNAIELTRKGNSLQGAFGGLTINFTQR